MNLKKKVVSAVLCVGMLLSAVYIVSAAEAGGADDPLVTLSYLNSVYKEEIKKELLQELKGDLTSLAASEYVVVELNAKQKLIMTSSGEIVLRMGSAVCVSPHADTGIGNLSEGYDIQNGQSVPKNNLILVARDDGRGIQANEFCYVMVRGSYKIS